MTDCDLPKKVKYIRVTYVYNRNQKNLPAAQQITVTHTWMCNQCKATTEVSRIKIHRTVTPACSCWLPSALANYNINSLQKAQTHMPFSTLVYMYHPSRLCNLVRIAQCTGSVTDKAANFIIGDSIDMSYTSSCCRWTHDSPMMISPACNRDRDTYLHESENCTSNTRP